MKLSYWFDWMKEMESSRDVVEGLNEENRKEYLDEVERFWKFEEEDRDIVLEDLKCEEGLLYKKMVDWNKNEIVKKNDFNMVWWEYSLEDYFRDVFNNEEREDEFSLFSYKDINKMMYGDDYDDDDY